MASKKPAPPQGLRPGGRKLWTDVVGKWELRPDELRVLREACREVDLIDALELALSKDALMIPGSMGQRVVNPLVTELRQHRATLAALLRQLKLPDADGNEGEKELRSTAARAAANARWGARGRSA
ncbi:hypothetical protein [Nocardia farcinica]|uniref:hypothetical protein n=1 Tax=Nocardia farcinica TaxID=37329 RepID=UPI00189613AD|nr:hypothetical protein [Nocardia farcinica]MBF6315036.1 hypothetical protein [Nocardia farcinica]MBF6573743.1 hypothetical protein [Nocardia farcinica]